MSSLLFGLRRHLAEWLPRSPALPRFRHWTSLELPTFTLTNSLLRVLILGLLDVIDLQQVASEFHVINFQNGRTSSSFVEQIEVLLVDGSKT